MEEGQGYGSQVMNIIPIIRQSLNRHERCPVVDRAARPSLRNSKLYLYSVLSIIAIIVLFLFFRQLASLEGVILDKGHDWHLEECSWKGYRDVDLVFLNSRKHRIRVSYKSGHFDDKNTCVISKVQSNTFPSKMWPKTSAINVLPESALEDALIRIVGQSLRKELAKTPRSLAVIGGLVVVNDGLKVPTQNLAAGTGLSSQVLDSLPPNVLEKRLFGNRSETEAMIRLIEERYSE
jgi:hypothetical protein